MRLNFVPFGTRLVKTFCLDNHVPFAPTRKRTPSRMPTRRRSLPAERLSRQGGAPRLLATGRNDLTGQLAPRAVARDELKGQAVCSDRGQRQRPGVRKLDRRPLPPSVTEQVTINGHLP